MQNVELEHIRFLQAGYYQEPTFVRQNTGPSSLTGVIFHQQNIDSYQIMLRNSIPDYQLLLHYRN